jgi:hypothetical protein
MAGSTRKYKLEGIRFGRLLVLEYISERKTYICKCDCGNYKELRSIDLRRGSVKSCGCLHKERELDLVGQKFTMLTVTERLGKTKDGHYLFKCICDCGNEKVIEGRLIKKGAVTSCGCRKLEITKEVMSTHGLSSSRIYATYNHMKLRCYHTENKAYHHYGGRGIKICDEWLGENGFINFYNWSMENGYTEKLSIDRIDNNGNYEPNNCRWVTMTEQANNKRTNLYFTYNGETKTLTEWCNKLGLKYDPVRKRIVDSGYSFEKAITHNIHRIKIN